MKNKMLKQWPVLGALPFVLLAACDQQPQETAMEEQSSAPAPAIAEGTTMPAPLGLPPIPIPGDNPMSDAKVALGEQLFNDARLSTTGEVSCATCHDASKAFTDSPLRVSEGIEGKTGTRNAPTVINAAYMKRQFWDGREPDLEGQSKGPLINPVEMGQPDHDAVLTIIRADQGYQDQFRDVFGVEPADITIDHYAKAVAAFERTVVSGNSPFDRWLFGGEEDAISESAKRGFTVYTGQGRCVDCHTISQTYATFTDGKFHNLNVNFGKIAGAVSELTTAFEEERASGNLNLDEKVLTDVDISELGRFAVTGVLADVGAFKTPTLRNVNETAPYMHDGSQKTLKEVVDFYNLGGRTSENDPVNPFQSGGIRPLNLSEQQKVDLVNFLQTLTSPEFEQSQ